jgi:Lon protease-like protein
MSPDTLEIPLFPLRTVLFPDGPLPLKIFETRYLDMIGQCLREERGFGVVTILHESEKTAGDGDFAAVGTLARIADWYRMDDGLLGITAVGESRFYVQSTRRQPDRLWVGGVNPIEPDVRMPVPRQYRPLIKLLENILAENSSHYQHTGREFEDAAWVGYRLAEMLPLSLSQRQMCLKITDPLERLEIIYPVLESVSK